MARPTISESLIYYTGAIRASVAGCPTHPRGSDEWVYEGEEWWNCLQLQMGRSIRAGLTESFDSGTLSSENRR